MPSSVCVDCPVLILQPRPPVIQHWVGGGGCHRELLWCGEYCGRCEASAPCVGMPRGAWVACKTPIPQLVAITMLSHPVGCRAARPDDSGVMFPGSWRSPGPVGPWGGGLAWCTPGSLGRFAFLWRLDWWADVLGVCLAWQGIVVAESVEAGCLKSVVALTMLADAWQSPCLGRPAVCATRGCPQDGRPVGPGLAWPDASRTGVAACSVAQFMDSGVVFTGPIACLWRLEWWGDVPGCVPRVARHCLG